MKSYLSLNGALCMKDKSLREKMLSELTERPGAVELIPKKSVFTLGSKYYRPLPNWLTMSIWVSRCR